MAKAPPKGWESDPLSEFLTAAHKNQWATFANRPIEFARLREVDNAFLRLSAGWRDPEHPLCALMLFRSHAAFRAACGLAFACQLAELYPVARVCLEYGGYALRMSGEHSLAEVWIRRNDSEHQRNKCKREFSNGAVKRSLEARNQELSTIYNNLYDRCIDFGAHPNERGVIGTLKIADMENEIHYNVLYLSGDPVAIDHALRVTAQIGVCSLSIFELVFPQRFHETGVGVLLASLKIGL